MAAWNLSRDVICDSEHSGGTSRPPLPWPDNGDNVRPLPLWEREFCCNAYDIPWGSFCENKRFIGLFKNVMDWDDSGALKNFEDAKERFRAKYHGEPYEDPVLDPDMYIDEVDHHCKVDPELVGDLDKVARLDLVADLGWGGMPKLTAMSWGQPIGNLIPAGWGEPVPNLTPTGWGETANPTPDQTPEAVRGAQPYCTPNNSDNNLHGGGPSDNRRQQGVDPGHTSSGTARMLSGGGRMWISGASGGGARNWNGGGGGGNGSGRNGNGGSGSGGGGGGGSNGRNWNSGGGGGGGISGRGRNWNCFGGGSSRNRNGGGGGKQRNQDVGQHQQRNGGGTQRNLDEGRHQMRSGGRQQQDQRGRKMEWRPVQHNRAPKDGPAA